MTGNVDENRLIALTKKKTDDRLDEFFVVNVVNEVFVIVEEI